MTTFTDEALASLTTHNNPTLIRELALEVIRMRTDAQKSPVTEFRRVSDVLAEVVARVQAIESLLQDGEQAGGPADTPRTKPSLGLATKVAKMWALVGGDYHFEHDKRSLYTLVSDSTVRAIASIERTLAEDAESKTLRGRVRGILQRAIIKTYPRTDLDPDTGGEIDDMQVGIFK